MQGDACLRPDLAARAGAELADPTGLLRELAAAKAQLEACENDRERQDTVYDQALKPIVEAYYATAQSLAALPVGESTRTSRGWLLGRLNGLQEAGDVLADALNVATPEWECMYRQTGGMP